MSFSYRDGIKVVKVKNEEEGIDAARQLLYETLGPKTALFLSGGRTPKEFYTILARDQKLKTGAVGLVDERFGEKFHENSNELMIKNSGLMDYLQDQNTRFYPILNSKTIDETTKDYDETLRFLLGHFPKSVGILGVGLDGHTAGVPAISEISEKIVEDKSSLVVFYDDNGKYGKRITMTFNALEKFDLLIVLVFGDDKKEALKLMFSDGELAEVPSRFLRKKGIAEKTLLITDQKV